jgi:hypothetical protein
VDQHQRRRSWVRAWTSVRLWVLIGLVSREILKVERKFSSSFEAKYRLWRRASEGQEVLVHDDKDIFQQNAFCTYKGLKFHIFDGDGVADLEALCLSVGERDETWRTAATCSTPWQQDIFLVVPVSTKKERSGQIFPRNLRVPICHKLMT